MNAKILEHIKAVEKAEGELLKERVKLTKLLSEKEKLSSFANSFENAKQKQESKEIQEAINE